MAAQVCGSTWSFFTEKKLHHQGVCLVVLVIARPPTNLMETELFVQCHSRWIFFTHFEGNPVEMLYSGQAHHMIQQGGGNTLPSPWLPHSKIQECPFIKNPMKENITSQLPVNRRLERVGIGMKQFFQKHVPAPGVRKYPVLYLYNVIKVFWLNRSNHYMGSGGHQLKSMSITKVNENNTSARRFGAVDRAEATPTAGMNQAVISRAAFIG